MRASWLKLFAQTAKDNTFSLGALAIVAIIIVIPLLVVVLWLKADYKNHKRPLRQADPNVKYTFWHHIKVVTIPLLSYRITFMIQKKSDKN